MNNIIVIKCGGSMIDELSKEFFDDLKEMKNNGYYPIIVHGGGPAINRLLDELHIETEFVNGLRKTTKPVMNVVEMVLSGTITNQLVCNMQKHGLPAIGITGSDGGLLYAEAIDFNELGFVGNITKINKGLLFNLMEIGLIPVISPIAVGNDHKHFYNINADTAAAEIAIAVNAEKILFVTDVPGVLKNNQLVERATKTEILSLIEDGTISGGMIPKVKAAIRSLDGGMDEVMIVNGKKHILRGIHFVGTAIHKELEAVK